MKPQMEKFGAHEKVSKGPPTMAVLPSADSATEVPCSGKPTEPVPTSLACWAQTAEWLKEAGLRRAGPLRRAFRPTPPSWAGLPTSPAVLSEARGQRAIQKAGPGLVVS
jgi:hypothetical protein